MAVARRLAVMLALCTLVLNAEGYWSKEDQRVRFCCPRGHSLDRIESVYSGFHKDRKWHYGCRPNPAIQRAICRWTAGYVNDWDAGVFFACPRGGFVTGIDSYHNNKKEDRRFKLKCCYHRSYKANLCQMSSRFENKMRGHLNFFVPRGYFLTGMFSVHDNGKEDRQWRFQYCRVTFTCRVLKDGHHGYRPYKRA